VNFQPLERDGLRLLARNQAGQDVGPPPPTNASCVVGTPKPCFTFGWYIMPAAEGGLVVAEAQGSLDRGESVMKPGVEVASFSQAVATDGSAGGLLVFREASHTSSK